MYLNNYASSFILFWPLIRFTIGPPQHRKEDSEYSKWKNVSWVVLTLEMSMSRTGMAVEKRKISKISDWRHYLLKTRANRKKNWQNHGEWLDKSWKKASKLKKFPKQGNWVPYELKSRYVDFTACQCSVQCCKTMWKPYLSYFPDVIPSDYHLFRSLAHGLTHQHSRSYAEVKISIDSWTTSKDAYFFKMVLDNCQKGGKK